MSQRTIFALLGALVEALPGTVIELTHATRIREDLESAGYALVRLDTLLRPNNSLDVEINAVACEVKWGEHWIRVTQYELIIIRLLLAQQGKFVALAALMFAIHGHLKYGNSEENRYALIRSHIKRIRQKFAKVDPGFAAIESRHGVGYRWHQTPDTDTHASFL